MAEEIPKQTTPEQETTAPTGKKKKEKGKSFLETMREIDAKEQQQEEAREAAMQAQLAEQEKREKEAYGKKSWKFACRAAFFSFQDVLLQSGRFR